MSKSEFRTFDLIVEDSEVFIREDFEINSNT